MAEKEAMMRKLPILVLLGLASLTAGCTMSAAPDASPEVRADLARSLAGRVARPPLSCVGLRDLGGNRTVGDAIIFGGDNRRIYVNRPPGGCPSLAFGRTLRVGSTTGQLCRGDIATVVDLLSGTEYGACGLGDFTPYDRTN
jgi:hypothetical protein